MITRRFFDLVLPPSENGDLCLKFALKYRAKCIKEKSIKLKKRFTLFYGEYGWCRLYNIVSLFVMLDVD